MPPNKMCPPDKQFLRKIRIVNVDKFQNGLNESWSCFPVLDLYPGVDDPFPNEDIAYDTINTQELMSNDEVLAELTVPVVKSNILPEGSTVLASRPKFNFKRPNQPIQVRSPAKKMRTPMRDIGNEIQDVTKGTIFNSHN